MVTVLLVLALLALAAVVFAWALHGMLTHICPTCLQRTGAQESVIPVLPLARWWCPSCSTVHRHGDVLTRGADTDDDEDAPPRI